ncbi:protein PSK SIMULATOR 2-like [Amaranthus tricolor]|uniref:protein PSK SIMULATOR 2-like n=1 Tax=Amaranthus tricolor TaxID=29722 RepID=UPI002585D903|nr:protein PSK SIMULATOR 2-like [Amaranthus tricolor]
MVSGILRHRLKNSDHSNRWIFRHFEKRQRLEILSFDTAKSMSRLISLYKSVSDDQIQRLRKQLIHGTGITFLISDDHNFLLTLACAERLEDLDVAASVVSHLGHKCSDYGLLRFFQVYIDLKNGELDLHKLYNNYGSKEMEKTIAKMDKLTSLTGELYAMIEELTQMEVFEELIDWSKTNNAPNTNYDFFISKITNQRKLVRHLKQVSLWNQSYDKIVGLMAKMICVLYARIFHLFRPYISISSKIGHYDTNIFKAMSGPTQSTYRKPIPLVRFLSSDSTIFLEEDVKLWHGLRNYNKHMMKTNYVYKSAPPWTVGGCGLAIRYANIILLSVKYLNEKAIIGDEARHNLYNMLPSSLKSYVRSKLRIVWRDYEDGIMYDGEELAEGWRKAVEDMLEWLIPMAQDTVTWQVGRNVEKQRFDCKPTVLLAQTLHYADLQKCEVAIGEVLVGLSCICLYENRRVSCLDIY